MKNKVEIWIVLIIAVLYGCNGKFHHYEFQQFKDISDKNDSFPNLYSDIFLKNKTYVLRLNNREEYIGNELVRFLDTSSRIENHHMSYFYFQDSGKVFYNTFSFNRDTFKIKDTLEWHNDGKIPPVKICNADQHFSRQGHYRLIYFDTAKDATDQKDVFKSSKNKIFIEMELERKVNYKFRDNHYVIRGEIGYNNGTFNDTLHLINIKIPRKWSPIRNLNSVESNRQQIKLDGLFNFDLKFIAEESTQITDIEFRPCKK